MTVTYKVTVSLINMGIVPASIDVKAIIHTYRNERRMLFWSTKELVSEETRYLSFIYSGDSWYQVVDGEPVKCEYYVETHPGDFPRRRLHDLWNDEKNLIDAKETLKKKLQKEESRQ